MSTMALAGGCTATKRKRHLVLADPTIGGTVALWLAEGAVSYIGGMLMGDILGHPGFQDVELYIKRAVEELKQFIRSELQKQFQENDLRKLSSLQDAGKRNLLRFHNAPDSEKKDLAYRLHDADIKTSESMSFAATFSYLGLNVYASSVSLRLLAFESSWTSFQLKSSLVSAKDTAKEGIGFLTQGLADYRKSWQIEYRRGQKYFLNADSPQRQFMKGFERRDSEGQ